MLGLIIWGTVLISGAQHDSEDCNGLSRQWTAVARTVVFGSWAALGLVFLVWHQGMGGLDGGVSGGCLVALGSWEALGLVLLVQGG